MLKWAQRRDRLFITLDVQDVTGEEVSLSEDALVFSGHSSGGRRYAMLLKFYKPVDPKNQVSVESPVLRAQTSLDPQRSSGVTSSAPCIRVRTRRANGLILAETSA